MIKLVINLLLYRTLHFIFYSSSTMFHLRQCLFFPTMPLIGFFVCLSNGNLLQRDLSNGVTNLSLRKDLKIPFIT